MWRLQFDVRTAINCRNALVYHAQVILQNENKVTRLFFIIFIVNEMQYANRTHTCNAALRLK